MSKLSDLCLQTISKQPIVKEDVEAIWDSPEFKQANGLEVSFANTVLGFAYVRCELSDIKKELEAINKKLGL